MSLSCTFSSFSPTSTYPYRGFVRLTGSGLGTGTYYIYVNGWYKTYVNSSGSINVEIDLDTICDGSSHTYNFELQTGSVYGEGTTIASVSKTYQLQVLNLWCSTGISYYTVYYRLPDASSGTSTVNIANSSSNPYQLVVNRSYTPTVSRDVSFNQGYSGVKWYYNNSSSYSYPNTSTTTFDYTISTGYMRYCYMEAIDYTPPVTYVTVTLSKNSYTSSYSYSYYYNGVQSTGTFSGSGQSQLSVDQGSTFTVSSVSASSGYTFSYVEETIQGGSQTYSSLPASITMTQNKAVAVYCRANDTCTINCNLGSNVTGLTVNYTDTTGSTASTHLSSSGTIVTLKNTQATFTAVTASGYVFESYTIDGTTYYTNPKSVTINKTAYTVSVYARQQTYNQTEVIVKCNSGINSISYSYYSNGSLTTGSTTSQTTIYADYNSNVQVTASVASGKNFNYFRKTIQGGYEDYTNNPSSINVTVDCTIEAYSKVTSVYVSVSKDSGVSSMQVTYIDSTGTTQIYNGTSFSEYCQQNSPITILANFVSGYTVNYIEIAGTRYNENPAMGNVGASGGYCYINSRTVQSATVDFTLQSSVYSFSVHYCRSGRYYDTTITSNTTLTVDRGTSITVTANMEAGQTFGYHYYGVSGSEQTSTSNPTSYTVSSSAITWTAYSQTSVDKEVIIRCNSGITSIDYSYTHNSTTYSGTTSSSATITVDVNSSVTVTATVESGKTFYFYRKTIQGGYNDYYTNPLTNTITVDCTIEAFVQVAFCTVNVSKYSGEGSFISSFQIEYTDNTGTRQVQNGSSISVYAMQGTTVSVLTTFGAGIQAGTGRTMRDASVQYSGTTDYYYTNPFSFTVPTDVSSGTSVAVTVRSKQVSYCDLEVDIQDEVDSIDVNYTVRGRNYDTTISSDTTITVDQGTAVTVEAHMKSGYNFGFFYYGVQGGMTTDGNNPTSFTPNVSAMICSAYTAWECHAYRQPGSALSSVSTTVSQAQVTPGMYVTWSCTISNPCYYFVGWYDSNGNLVSSSASYTAQVTDGSVPTDLYARIGFQWAYSSIAQNLNAIISARDWNALIDLVCLRAGVGINHVSNGDYLTTSNYNPIASALSQHIVTVLEEVSASRINAFATGVNAL